MPPFNLKLGGLFFNQFSVLNSSLKAVKHLSSVFFTVQFLRVGCLAQHMNSRSFGKLTACTGYVFGNLQRRQCVFLQSTISGVGPRLGGFYG